MNDIDLGSERSQFTHYVEWPEGEAVDYVAGDVTTCVGCQRQMFRRYAYVFEGNDPRVVNEPRTVWGQIAAGRLELDAGAEPANEGDRLCESCEIELEQFLSDGFLDPEVR